MAVSTTSKQILALARAAGYEVIAIDQPRPKRWVLQLQDGAGAYITVMVQQRALVSAADVQDLAELLRLRHSKEGVLLALGGTFSPVAHRTAQELRDTRILLCTSLPTAPSSPKASPVLSSL
jgi:hypothetical protein